MRAIAWIGALALAMTPRRLDDLRLPLVAFAAGSLLAGAVLHLLPESIAIGGDGVGTRIKEEIDGLAWAQQRAGDSGRAR